MEEHLQRPGKRHADDDQGDCVPAMAEPPASTDDVGEDVSVKHDDAGHHAQHRAHKRSTHAQHEDTESTCDEVHKRDNRAATGGPEGDHAGGCAAVYDDAEAATRAFNDAVQRLKDLRAQGG